MSVIYNMVMVLAIPFILLRLLIKSRGNSNYRDNILERFSINLPKPKDNVLLFHAVSVGEFLALKPLLEHIIDNSQYNLWITCTTPTGRAQIKKFSTRHSSRVQYSYLPYDAPLITGRFLRLIKPRLFAFVETEIWPNFLKKAESYKFPTLLLNARLSEKSFKGYQKYIPKLMNESLKNLHISAQTDLDSQRLISLGVNPKNSIVINSLKLHIPAQKSSKQKYKLTTLPQTWIWIAASTHYPEEHLCLSAHVEIRKKHHDALLCIAPRHPERYAQIAKEIQSAGLSPKRLSQNEKIVSQNDVLIIDTIGDLDDLYDQADVAFIGGSLINHGGQNPLGALLKGCSVCFGPHMRNFQSISRLLLEQSFVEECDEQHLAQTVTNLKEMRTENTKKTVADYRFSLDDNVIEKHYERIINLIH